MSTKKKTIEETYTKKEPIEHILLRPDTYVGDVSQKVQKMFVCDYNEVDGTNVTIIREKEITVVLALYKIFDEILVNAADQSKIDPTCKAINVHINQETGVISVLNSGTGIPVVEHNEHKMYIPSLIFGELLTGSNFNDDDGDRVTGGRNGYGAKLTNIFSRRFEVETVDSERGLKFIQVFENNLSVKGTPKITKSKVKGYTKISFLPDYQRFGFSGLTNDMRDLFMKRVYDLAGVCSNVIVHLNDTKITQNTFKKYMSLYKFTELDIEPVSVYEEVNERWKVGLMFMPNTTYRQISFVNSINTYNGGTHVDLIVDAVVKRVQELIKKKNGLDKVSKGKGSKPEQKPINITPAMIKENMTVFICSTIVNPAFDSQSKGRLTTKANKFGSTCVLADRTLKTFVGSGIVDCVSDLVAFKTENTLMSKGKRGKNGKILDIPKLDDANFAGTKKSALCHLILTEGDSAKATAVAGLPNRDYYGIFPLKGKLLNVRDASAVSLSKNEEIENIVKILGLNMHKPYATPEERSSLRYGHVIIMTDQDKDGYHIQGLIINFFHYFWPALLRSNDFIFSLQTPIVKAKKGNKELCFYTEADYKAWFESSETATRGWTIKYYKGLGTSNQKEARECMADIETKLTRFVDDDNVNDIVSTAPPRRILKTGTKSKKSTAGSAATNSETVSLTSDIGTLTKKYTNESTEHITLAFEHTRADDRKIWLSSPCENVLSTEKSTITYTNFINKLLKQFSIEDCVRSIPSICDGFKPSQRKAFYATRLKKLDSESKSTKISQLSGFVGEKTAYHHGETSMNNTLTSMATNYVGSNNINLLVPNGQFGCLDPETPVLLWNGKSIPAKEIGSSDLLVGDDGTPRRILEMTSGVDTMYSVVERSTGSVLAKVNSEHIITCFFPDNYKLQKDKFGKLFYMFGNPQTCTLETVYVDERTCKNISKLNLGKSDIIDIKISSYLSLDPIIRDSMTGIRNSSAIQWPEQIYNIPPGTIGYVLGYIGTCNVFGFDILLPYINILKTGNFSVAPIKTEFTSEDISYINNLAKTFTVPDIYKLGSMDQRRELLQSFMSVKLSFNHVETIGKFTKINMFSTESTVLEQIVTIFNSLGYYAYWKTSESISHIFVSDSNIYGLNTFKFDIKVYGIGEFIGWQLDGNERFLLGNYVVTHNSRLVGGKDASSPRYIETYLEEIGYKIFRVEDDPILQHVIEDGKVIEPIFYYPIVPMILINGSDGIGTGYSNKIPNYNIMDIIPIIQFKLENPTKPHGSTLEPWYLNFEGSIERSGPNDFTFYGKYRQIDATTIKITELPIGVWTESYKTFLSEEMQKEKIVDYVYNCSDTKIDIDVVFTPSVLAKMIQTGKVYSTMKLTSKKGISNMHLFDRNNSIRKYRTVEAIIDDFFEIRLNMYEKRKQYNIDNLQRMVQVVTWKMKFIKYVIENKIVVFKRSRDNVMEQVRKYEFPELITSESSDNQRPSFDYITKIPLFSMTQDKVDELQNTIIELEAKLLEEQVTTPEQRWKQELVQLEEHYAIWYEMQQAAHNNTLSGSSSGTSAKKLGKGTKKTKVVKKSKS